MLGPIKSTEIQETASGASETRGGTLQNGLLLLNLPTVADPGSQSHVQLRKMHHL